MMNNFLDEIEDYRIDYSGFSRNGVVPKIKPVISHVRRRFKQRFGEDYEGPYGTTYNTIAGLINNGMTEVDLYQFIDYYFGYVADKVVHNISMMSKVRLSYYTFFDQNRRNKKSGEDWYAYCIRIKGKDNKFNQSTKDLDTILVGLCKKMPNRKLKVIV